MFDSAILEVGIGMAFVFLMVSMLVSAVAEMLSAVLKWRARHLWHGVENLLQSTEARNQLYAHPLIKGLSQVAKAGGKWKSGRNGPSYIPARTFALALVDIIRRPSEVTARIRAQLQGVVEAAEKDPTQLLDLARRQFDALSRDEDLPEALKPVLEGLQARVLGRSADANQALNEIKTFLTEEIRAGLDHARHHFGDAVESLTALLDDAANDMNRFRENVEAWFNDGMDRVSGWYKRYTMAWQVAIALALAVALNIDALHVTRTLWREPSLRQALASRAEKAAAGPAPSLERPPLKVTAPAGSAAPAALAVRLGAAQVTSGEAVPAYVSLPDAKAADRSVTAQVTTGHVRVASKPDDPGGREASVSLKEGEPEATLFLIGDTVTAESLERIAFTAQGASVDAQVVVAPRPEKEFEALRADIDSLGLPIGWSCGQRRETRIWCGTGGAGFLPVLVAWGALLLGWLITAAAASLGAPFWFDILKKFVSVRSTGKAPEEKPISPKEVPKPLEPGQRPREAAALDALKGSARA